MPSKRSGAVMGGGGFNSLMAPTKKAPKDGDDYKSPKKPSGRNRDHEGAARIGETPGFKEEKKSRR